MSEAKVVFIGTIGSKLKVRDDYARIPVFGLNNEKTFMSFTAFQDMSIRGDDEQVNRLRSILADMESEEVEYFTLNEEGREMFKSNSDFCDVVRKIDLSILEEPMLYISADAIAEIVKKEKETKYLTPLSILSYFDKAILPKKLCKNKSSMSKQQFSVLRELSRKYWKVGERKKSINALERACRYIDIPEDLFD